MANFSIFGTLKSIVPDLGSLADLSAVSSGEADALEVRVDLVCRDLLAKEVCEELSGGEKEVLPLVAEAYSKIRQVVDSSMLAPPSIFQACLIVDGNVGRPQFDIPHQQLI